MTRDDLDHSEYLALSQILLSHYSVHWTEKEINLYILSDFHTSPPMNYLHSHWYLWRFCPYYPKSRIAIALTLSPSFLHIYEIYALPQLAKKGFAYSTRKRAPKSVSLGAVLICCPHFIADNHLIQIPWNYHPYTLACISISNEDSSRCQTSNSFLSRVMNSTTFS